MRLDMNASALRNPRDPTMADSQEGVVRQYLAGAEPGLITVAQSHGRRYAPVYACMHQASDMHATQTNIPVTQATNTFNLNLAGLGIDTSSISRRICCQRSQSWRLQEVDPDRPLRPR